MTSHYELILNVCHPINNKLRMELKKKTEIKYRPIQLLLNESKTLTEYIYIVTIILQH